MMEYQIQIIITSMKVQQDQPHTQAVEIVSIQQNDLGLQEPDLDRNYGLTDAEVAKFQQIFNQYDSESNGAIDQSELKDMLKANNLEVDADDLNLIIKEYDTDGNGTIEFNEFLQIFVRLSNPVYSSVEEDSELSESELNKPLKLRKKKKKKKKKFKKLASREIKEVVPEVLPDLPIIEELRKDAEKEEPDTWSARIRKLRNSDSQNPKIENGQVMGTLDDPKKPKLIFLKGKVFQFDKGLSMETVKEHEDEVHYRNEVEVEVEKKSDQEESAQKKSEESANRRKEDEPVKTKLFKKEKFSWWKSSLGVLAFGSDARSLTPAERKLGPSLTIYFRQVKMLSILFVIFSLFSLPQIVLFNRSSNESQLKSLHYNQSKAPSFLNQVREKVGSFFLDISLQSLGKPDFLCEGFRISDLWEFDPKNPGPLRISRLEFEPDPVNITNVELKCHHGQIATLIDFGLSTYDSICPSVNYDTPVQINAFIDAVSTDPNCNYRNLAKNSTEFQNINNEFRKHLGKENATFSLNAKEMFTQSCYRQIKNLQYISQNNTFFDWKPKIYLVAQCTEPVLNNPMTGKDNISRKILLALCACTDLVVVFCFMLSLIFIRKISTKAYTEYKDQVNELETRDFSIQITNLPPVKEYKHETILKCLLWQHFEDVISKTPQQIKALQKTQKYQNQIVDIFFGMQNYGPIMKLLPIKDKYLQIGHEIVIAENLERNVDRKLVGIEKKIEKQKKNYFKAQNIQYNHEVEEVYKKGGLTKQNALIAFIIFRSMEGQKRALKAYFQEKSMLKSIKAFITKRILNKPIEEDKTPLFMGKYRLNVEAACDSNLVKWNGFGKGICRSICKNLMHYLTRILLFLTGIYIIWAIKYVRDDINFNFPDYRVQNLHPLNKSMELTQAEALNDQYNGTIKVFQEFSTTIRYGLMQEYCHQKNAEEIEQEVVINEEASTSRLEELRIEKRDEIYSLCNQYENARTYTLLLDMGTAFAIAVMNQLVLSVYQSISWSQFYETKTHQSLYEMKESLGIQFLNSALLIVLANFRVKAVVDMLHGEGFLGQLTGGVDLSEYKKFVPMLIGSFNDVTVAWQQNVGRMICFTLIAHVVVNQFSLLKKYYMFRCRQRQDKRCARNKAKGTSKTSQLMLNALYTGQEFNMSQSYASIHLVCWVTMLYSSSMPVLYFVAAIFFVSTYFIEKFLMFNFYRKTQAFNEQLPLGSLYLFRYPVIFHCFFSFFVYSEGQVFFDAKITLQDLGLQQIDIDKFSDSDKGIFVEEQPQDSALLVREMYSTKTEFWPRFGQLHVILILLVWLCAFLVYNLHDKVSNCCTWICAKCRGEGEFEYDSEDDESEIDEHSRPCQKCEDEKKAKIERRKQIREMFMMRERDNNAYERELQEAKMQKSRNPNASSSDEDSNMQTLAKKDDKKESTGHYSDDFYKEIDILSLIYYRERNNQEMTKTINALTNCFFFMARNAKKRNLTDRERKEEERKRPYVGTGFLQNDMKPMVGIHKRKRKTFNRRLKQIMRKINPRISECFNEDPQKEAETINQQVALLQRLITGNPSMYLDSEFDLLHVTNQIEPYSWGQKQAAKQIQRERRIVSEIQTYDFRDSKMYQGVYSVEMLYKDEVKNELNTLQLKEFYDPNQDQGEMTAEEDRVEKQQKTTITETIEHPNTLKKKLKLPVGQESINFEDKDQLMKKEDTSSESVSEEQENE